VTVAELIEELQKLPAAAQSSEAIVATDVNNDAVVRVTYDRGEVQIVGESYDDE
jgi:hypothetical protein